MISKTMDKLYISCYPLFIVSLIIFSLIIVSFLAGNINLTVSGALPDNSTKSNTPINHVIVISQGKRSFDNYFGTFPGANGFPQNITVPLNPFSQNTEEFTVAAWFNTNNSLEKNGFLVNKGGIGVDTVGKNLNYGIWMNNKANIMGGFETSDGVDHILGSNGSYNDGKWHNVIVTYDGNNTLSLYIDGTLISTNNTGGAKPDIKGREPIRIGANSLRPDNHFVGLIDEVRIWNKSLGQPEIASGYINNTYDVNRQLVYLPFEQDLKKNINGNTTASSVLNGIYLNGSLYYDVQPNISTHTTFLKPYNLERTKTDPPHDSSRSYQLSYNNGFMNGFLYAQTYYGKDPNLVMGYYDSKQLPHYWQLASEFVLADNFYAPSMETGLANHQYLYTADSADYQKNTSFRGMINVNKTIFDELDAGGNSWKVYVEDYDPALNYTNDEPRRNRYINLLPAIPRFVDNETLNANIVDLVQYFGDLKSDDFPAISYIVPQSSDESSPSDVSKGEELASSVVVALMKSKHWNDSALIITYRESGGWYDHVKPPLRDGEPYGFRIPTLIISPYAKKGYVDSTVYDVTSILKFIEYNLGLPALSKLDAGANNMLNAFDFTQQPRQAPAIISVSDQNVTESQTVIVKNGESINIVNLIYIAVLSAIPAIAAIIWYLRGKSILNPFQGR